MFIRYQNLTIRNATPEDAPILCRWWNDGSVMAHAGFPNGLSTTVEKIIQQLSTDSDDTYRRLMIEVDNSPAGEMSYRNVGQQTEEIGVKICDASRQNKGHGTLFLKMLISALFAKGYERIILDTNLKNTRAQHVYEKIGFRKLRVNYNAWKDQLGVWQSSVEYALIKPDFIPLEISSALSYTK